ncbi:FAD-dependent oxidoreductase [Sphingomonas profundi]|uniref:FAD-dependent oxidoreductase n=1 Tax=Alterirhizorhabdus profundi TaxID=2681549 RepID=UPI0012E83BAB|nr:FAD-dependent oxidoreductase [Sphingomonas profundi]
MTDGTDFDVIVLGTGAAGLTAAIAAHEQGARVGLFEKGGLVGGTTAWSGGQVWIPANRQMLDLGKQDSPAEAVTYMMSMSNGLIERDMAETFARTGPEMVAFLEERTPVEFVCVPDFPDYHPEQPGGKTGGGRTLECPVYPFGELGEWADRVTVSPYWPNRHIQVGETTLCQAVPEELSDEVKQHRLEHDERGLGLALIGRLLRGCLDRGIVPQTEHRAVELVMDGGRVAGVRFETPDGERRVTAPRVIMATGGFEWDKGFTTAFLRGPLDTSVSVPTNTGDGLRMAMRVGAMLGNMREAWWMPVVEVPEEVCSAGKQLFTGERTLPGSIMVNRAGKRFTNEAANYNAFGAAFHEQETNSCSYANLPCWVIFTQSFYEKYGFAGGYGGERLDDRRPPQWIADADSLRGLAERMGIDPDGLEATVARWNANVEAGSDPDFKRGESMYDRWWGDPTCKGTRAATLGKLEQGPFYAVEVKSGALGTKGGPKTDADAQVLSVDMQPIAGLYAVGNVMASPMGMTYGGGGGTLGPGMVFGYRAGLHAGRAVAAETRQTEDA